MRVEKIKCSQIKMVVEMQSFFGEDGPEGTIVQKAQWLAQKNNIM